jgi:hypothetical protein
MRYLPNTQQKFAVIPAKLAIASASRNPVKLDNRFRGNDERERLTYCVNF